MRLILARHGNTFTPGDKVCWVGSRNDLPLVEQGVLQAERVARALTGVPLSAVYCAPLKRTKQYAEIVAAGNVSAPPLVEDARLTEIDYGQWSGLTDDEIVSKFGGNSLKDWMERSIWPENCGWSANERTVADEIKSFASDVINTHSSDATVLVVSSNGTLRYFLKLIEGEFDKRVTEHTFKVATGRICLLIAEGNKFQLRLWNEQPDALLNAVGGA